ncbi:MAG: hypothetical protein RIQ53_3297 [Pseudomonadota bacterium]|jgi:hypothetical protein
MGRAADRRRAAGQPRAQQCGGKVQYPTWTAADRGASNLMRALDYPGRAHPYHCRWCLRWHVGTSERTRR